MWKILTTQIIEEEIYYSQEIRRLFPVEQKGFHKRTRAAGDLLYILNIDQNILNESYAKQKNVAIAWVDCKKTYDIVSQT